MTKRSLPQEKSTVNPKLAEAFNNLLIFAQQKKLFPDLREYCEKFLGMKFQGNHARCPLHREKKGRAFHLRGQKWYCFGKCRRRWKWGGDVLDLHQTIFEFATKQEAMDSLLSLQLRRSDCRDLLPRRRTPPAPEVALNEKRLARLWRQYARVDREFLAKRSPVPQPSARDFAEILLELMDRGELPIVFAAAADLRYPFANPLIGQRARRALERGPERLQYLCSCTAQRIGGGNRTKNLVRRLFLDVEFDEHPLPQQLPLLWYLKEERGWPLVSITYSGDKSYHGLFRREGEIEAQRADLELVLSLGADAACLHAHQPVRFPGGWRRDDTHNCRQTLLYLDV